MKPYRKFLVASFAVSALITTAGMSVFTMNLYETSHLPLSLLIYFSGFAVVGAGVIGVILTVKEWIEA